MALTNRLRFKANANADKIHSSVAARILPNTNAGQVVLAFYNRETTLNPNLTFSHYAKIIGSVNTHMTSMESWVTTAASILWLLPEISKQVALIPPSHLCFTESGMV